MKTILAILLISCLTSGAQPFTVFDAPGFSGANVPTVSGYTPASRGTNLLTWEVPDISATTVSITNYTAVAGSLGVSFKQSTATWYPTLLSNWWNSRSGVFFTTNQYLSNTGGAFNVTQPITCWLAYQYMGTTNKQALWAQNDNYGASENALLFATNATTNGNLALFTGGSGTTTGYTQDTNQHLVGIIENGRYGSCYSLDGSNWVLFPSSGGTGSSNMQSLVYGCELQAPNNPDHTLTGSYIGQAYWYSGIGMLQGANDFTYLANYYGITNTWLDVGTNGGVTNTLIACWPLNGNTTDIVSGNNGTISGAGTSYVTGPAVGTQGLNFTGSQRVQIATNITLPSSWTITCWINLSASPASSGLIIGTNATAGPMFLSRGTAQTIGYYSGGNHDSGQAMALSTWQFCAVTFSGGVPNFYGLTNTFGADNNNGTFSGLSGGQVLYIGGSPAGFNIKASLANIRIYNGVLGPSAFYYLATTFQ